MSRKHDLRIQRTGTVINLTSKRQEKRLGNSLRVLSSELEAKFEIRLHHEKQWLLKDVVDELRSNYPEVDFEYKFDTSSMCFEMRG